MKCGCVRKQWIYSNISWTCTGCKTNLDIRRESCQLSELFIRLVSKVGRKKGEGKCGFRVFRDEGPPVILTCFTAAQLMPEWIWGLSDAVGSIFTYWNTLEMTVKVGDKKYHNVPKCINTRKKMSIKLKKKKIKIIFRNIKFILDKKIYMYKSEIDWSLYD